MDGNLSIFTTLAEAAVRNVSRSKETRITEFNLIVHVETSENSKNIVVPLDDGTSLSLNASNALRIYEAVRREKIMSDIDFILEENLKNEDGTYNLADEHGGVSIPEENKDALIAAAAISYISDLDESEDKWFEARTQDHLRSVIEDSNEE